MTPPVFHRLTVPTYFGGLPALYDYINDPGALSPPQPGDPAFADDMKGDGPNQGTYFTAFGEDATSNNVNRPARALSTNTDYLDDVVHRDVAHCLFIAYGGGDSPVLLGPDPTTNGGVYLGILPTSYDDLFHITDANDQDINVDGVRYHVTGIASGGSIGGGFSSGPVTVTIAPGTPSIPYRIHYATRTNAATIRPGAWSVEQIRLGTKASFAVEEMFRTLHGSTQQWQDPWDSTIYALARRGLDGAYRHNTSADASTAVNTPGAGATITRDGYAPQVVSASAQGTRAIVDPYSALFSTSTLDSGARALLDGIGSGGFYFKGSEWMVVGEDLSGALQPTPSLYSFLGLTIHGETFNTDSPTHGTGYATAIPLGTAATIAETVTQGIYVVVITASNAWFWNPNAPTAPSGQTAVALGLDMLEMEIGGMFKVTAVITAFVTSDATGKTVHVTALDGGTIPGVTSSPSVAQITWVQPRVGYRYGAAASKALFGTSGLGSEAFSDSGFFCVPPHAPLTTDVTDTTGEYQQVPPTATAYFGAHYDRVAGTTTPALAWGEFVEDMTSSSKGRWVTRGELRSDGSIHIAGDIYSLVGGNPVIINANTEVTGSITGDGSASLKGPLTVGKYGVGGAEGSITLLHGLLGSYNVNLYNGSFGLSGALLATDDNFSVGENLTVGGNATVDGQLNVVGDAYMATAWIGYSGSSPSTLGIGYDDGNFCLFTNGDFEVDGTLYVDTALSIASGSPLDAGASPAHVDTLTVNNTGHATLAVSVSGSGKFTGGLEVDALLTGGNVQSTNLMTANNWLQVYGDATISLPLGAGAGNGDLSCDGLLTVGGGAGSGGADIYGRLLCQGRLVVPRVADVTALTAKQQGDVAFDTGRNRLCYYDGSTWFGINATAL